MVYRYENGRPITDPRMLDVCKFAERDFLAKSDENEYYVDDTDGIYLCLWMNYDTVDEGNSCIAFEEIADYPAQSTFSIWGWDEFMRWFEQGSPNMELMPMASGAVYSTKAGWECWQYEFDVLELAKTESGNIWPEPWTTGRPSEYADMHPAQLERVRLFFTDYDFFYDPAYFG